MAMVTDTSTNGTFVAGVRVRDGKPKTSKTD